jgi:uncharacterized membrane protein
LHRFGARRGAPWRARAWLLSEWGRSLAALGVFYAFLGLHHTLGWERALLYPLGLNLAAATYLTLTWLVIVGASSKETVRWAASVEARSRGWQRLLGQEASLAFIVLISLFGLVAAVGLLPSAQREVT